MLCDGVGRWKYFEKDAGIRWKCMNLLQIRQKGRNLYIF
jgi:hypothetical protein